MKVTTQSYADFLKENGLVDSEKAMDLHLKLSDLAVKVSRERVRQAKPAFQLTQQKDGKK